LSSNHAPPGQTCHSLGLALRHRIGALSLDLSFSLTKPWSVLFAPSGAGKTTILRVIAGLLRPERGRILCKTNTGTPVILTDTYAGVFVPPHLRMVRLVAQQPALFPHLDVLKNIQYGMPRNEDKIHSSLAEILALCRIANLTTKMPAQLSGGERQRVALARVLATPGSRILLLDEPFTGMDYVLRDGLIHDLRLWLARTQTPVLQVTHDIAEAFATEAEVLTLGEGRLSAQGPAAEVLKDQRDQMLRRLTLQELVEKG